MRWTAKPEGMSPVSKAAWVVVISGLGTAKSIAALGDCTGSEMRVGVDLNHWRNSTPESERKWMTIRGARSTAIPGLDSTPHEDG